jgi:hypothetical protein
VGDSSLRETHPKYEYLYQGYLVLVLYTTVVSSGWTPLPAPGVLVTGTITVLTSSPPNKDTQYNRYLYFTRHCTWNATVPSGGVDKGCSWYTVQVLDTHYIIWRFVLRILQVRAELERCTVVLHNNQPMQVLEAYV